MNNAVVDAYTRWHQEHNASDISATAPWHLDAIQHIGDVAGRDVLEIGCGLGAFALELARRGARIVAADLIPFAVDETAERLKAHPNARAMIADIQDIPFPDESFDLVVSLETLEHVPHPARGLAELVRVTRRGGRIILTGPNYLSLMGVSRILLRLVGRRFTEMGQPVNKVTFLRRHVRRLRQLGCDIEAAYAHDHQMTIPGFPSFRIRSLDRLPLNRFAYQFCVVATRR